MVPRIELDPEDEEKLREVFDGLETRGIWAILEEGEVKPCSMGDAFLWICKNPDACKIGRDDVGDWEVSTSFAIAPMGYTLTSRRPLHLETMFFHPEKDCRTFRRYFTLAEAVQGHKEACEHAATFE